MSEIRKPTHKSAIEKKNKIVEEGFKLICEKGYYNINTRDIALKANVSTGIIYQYFNNKHEIFIEGLNKYADKIFYPSININMKIDNNNLKEFIKYIINLFIDNHKLLNNAHEEIMAMVHTDKDVRYYYQKREMDLTNNIYGLLKDNNFNEDNLKEKIHISLGLIDNLCHELIYHKHNEINYNIMKDIVINLIYDLLTR